MRVAVVSDVHGNLLALEQVLADFEDVDAIWCLGDFVGYGPWPNECVELLRARNVVAIAGNHDLAAIGAITTDDFNPVAARGTEWTSEHLTQETRAYLESLEPMTEVSGTTLAHGSPRHPVWEYLTHESAAAESFTRFSTPLCLVGHTHIPTLFVRALRGDAALASPATEQAWRKNDSFTTWHSSETGMAVPPLQGEVRGSYMEAGSLVETRGYQAIANPGSVGQPRDGDHRASYLVLDTEKLSLEWRRVGYDVAAVQTKILRVSLPTHNATRLATGS